MFNRTAIMKEAHRIARDLAPLESACAPRPYRELLAIGLKEAWRKAKLVKPTVDPSRLVAIRQQIFAEECRPRMNFALVSSLRAEVAQLQAAA